jgi:hypothetical protein
MFSARAVLKASLTALLAALAVPVLLLPATAASAGAPATNYKTQLLTEYPDNSMPTSTVSRSIVLASGTYYWTVDIGTPQECANPATCPVVGQRQIWLIAGTYDWHCYLDPRSDGYVEWCTLKRAGYPQESVSSGVFRLRASGDRTWGGFLSRIGA